MKLFQLTIFFNVKLNFKSLNKNFLPLKIQRTSDHEARKIIYNSISLSTISAANESIQVS